MDDIIPCVRNRDKTVEKSGGVCYNGGSKEVIRGPCLTCGKMF